jgi:uncharacterized protein (TIGR02996 family)
VDTESAFLRSIEADLDDPAPILIYADWLEEQGKDQLAYAWRWMGRRGYRPAKRTRPRARIPWAWWHTSSHEMATDLEDLADLHLHPRARLPVLLFRAMGSAGAHIYCRNLAEAAERLAGGLQVLGELVGPERQSGDP